MRHRHLPSDHDRHDQQQPDPIDPISGRTWRPRRHRGEFPGAPFDAAGFEPAGFDPARHGGGPGGAPHEGESPFRHMHEHGFGFRGRGPGHGPGRRAGRGDIRAAILLLLVEQPMHGYQLIQEIGERSGGQWRPSPGAIYPALAMLEDEGLVDITAESGRKLASLTADGRDYVTTHADELGQPWQDAQGRPARPGRALRDAIESLAGAAAQVARTGDETQNTQALGIIERARRELYLVLAGEPEPQSAPRSSHPTTPTD